MTMLEKILTSRAWRGAEVTRGEHNGRPAYLLEHKSGATAIVYAEPGEMDSRKWRAWAWKQECARRGLPAGVRR